MPISRGLLAGQYGRKKTTTNHNRGGLANAGSVWIADDLSVNGMTTIHWRPKLRHSTAKAPRLLPSQK